MKILCIVNAMCDEKANVLLQVCMHVCVFVCVCMRVCVHACVCMCALTCMSQTEGPEAQVRGRVGDAAQTILYGVNGLVNCNIPEIKLWREEKDYRARPRT